VSVRSVALGLAGTVLICGLTPYNDFALNNTPLVGNNLPIGVVAYALMLALLNAVIARRFPRAMLTTGELTVAFSMSLVACSVPSAGLLRYLPAALVTPFWSMRENSDYRSMIEAAGVPHWLLPQYSGKSPAEWANDPLVSGFVWRWTGSPNVNPILGWVQPILVWGVFLFALYGALMCIVILVRRQWVENERLAFPLAQVGLALVEQPRPGQRLNEVLSKRSFWVAFGAVFLLHIYNGLSNYYPAQVPRIPTSYHLGQLMSESPVFYARPNLGVNWIYFIVIGATFFIPSAVAFSLWGFFVLEQIFAMTAGGLTGDSLLGGTYDRHIGAIIAFALSILWIGRHHWLLILRQAMRGRREGELEDPYLSYAITFWVLVGCTLTMIGWMMLAGCNLPAAVVAVLLLLTLFVVITRVIAESGLVHGMLIFHLTRPWEILSICGAGKMIPLKSFSITGMVDNALFDFREVPSVYASHNVKIADQTKVFAGQRRGGLKFIAVMMLALFVGYFVGFGSTLWTEYQHGYSLDASAISPINRWGVETAPRWFQLDPGLRYQQQNYQTVHNPVLHVGIGFVMTAALAALRLMFAWWPLHPVGFLMLGTFPGAVLWFSIMIGWLLKVLILRFGGAKLYSAARPFFLGLIVGESMAAAFWLITGIVIAAFGGEYRPILILPV
jgi:hypothetical protein